MTTIIIGVYIVGWTIGARQAYREMGCPVKAFYCGLLWPIVLAGVVFNFIITYKNEAPR